MAVQRESVLIIGAGPAGLATAIELRTAAPDLEVVVVETGEAPAERFGETVPGDILLALERLGLSDAFKAAGHIPCPGSLSLWGSAKPGHNDYILNPLGPAWHISRVRFEAMLRARALELGAAIITEVRRASWVVDASGWQAWFARRQGVTRRIQDRMVAIVRFAALRAGTFTAQTVLEATPHGWWYGARVPDDQLVTVLVTEPRAARALTRDGHAGWREQLAATQLFAPRLDACRLADERFHAYPVPSVILDRVEGDGWLAVGDAASAYDPIASQGINKALADAADASRRILGGAASYSEHVTARFDDYLAARAQLYAREPRWPDRPFWRSRARA